MGGRGANLAVNSGGGETSSSNNQSSPLLNSFDEYRFGDMNARRDSNKYYSMDRVSPSGDKIIVSISDEHLRQTPYGYALMLDDSNVVYLKNWQVDSNYFQTNVILNKQYFTPKPWSGRGGEFGSIPENLTWDTWLKTAKAQQSAGNRVKWKIDGATRMIESFNKQREKRK